MTYIDLRASYYRVCNAGMPFAWKDFLALDFGDIFAFINIAHLHFEAQEKALNKNKSL